MKRLVSILAIVAALLPNCWLVAQANASQPQQVDVTLTDFKIAMSTTELPAGTPLRLVVTNKGAIMHELVLEKAGVVDEAVEVEEQEGSEAEAEVEDIAPGQTKSVVWTIEEPGSYQVACHVPGHYEAGMVLDVTFKASGVTMIASQAGKQSPASQMAGMLAATTAHPASQVAAPATLPVTGDPLVVATLWPAAGLGILLLALGWTLRTRRLGR